jgi:hypothetical protein
MCLILYVVAMKGVKTPRVQGWLLNARNPHSIFREKIRQRVLERMARKARVEELMRARNAPRKPGVIYFGLSGMHPTRSEKSAADKARDAAELALQAEERELRESRVAHLVMLRAGAENRRRFGCFSLKPRP